MKKITILSTLFAAAIAVGSLARVAHADLQPPPPPVEHPTEQPAAPSGEVHEAAHAAADQGPGVHEGEGPAGEHGAEPGAHGAEHAGGEHGGGHHADPSANFNWFKGIPFGYNSMDAKGGPLGDGKLGEGPNAPAVSPQEEEKMNAPFILMFVNFGILLIILAKFAGPAARKMAETRSDQIKNALDESARLRQEASDKLDEYKTKLADADAQINKMVEDMRAVAEADKNRILENANVQAEAMKRDAESRIAAEITRARAELKREVSLAATAAAEKMLRERANGSDHTKLVDSFIADLMNVPADNTKERR
ncbi:MAG TPA: ATP synthase F0 subunit B [Kofleriaceae bacterium]|nr:ATP synthase F0 subunit B [Kofleriaceae bacterium]